MYNKYTLATSWRILLEHVDHLLAGTILSPPVMEKGVVLLLPSSMIKNSKVTGNDQSTEQVNRISPLSTENFESKSPLRKNYDKRCRICCCCAFADPAD